MPPASLIKVEVGYSNTPEVNYALDSHVKLPVSEFLTEEITVLHKKTLDLFARWCRHYNLSPNSTVVFPWFVDFLHKQQRSIVALNPKMNRTYFPVTRDNRLDFLKLREAVKRAARVVSDQAASLTPPVTFHYISGRNMQEPAIDLKLRGTNASVTARIVQGDLKDSLHDALLNTHRPILDLGGGDDNLKKSALKNKGFDLEVVSYDHMKSTSMSFDSVDLECYKDHTLHLGHSSYHFSPKKFLDVVRRDPKGITLVLDGDADTIDVVGDDYEFHAHKIHGLNIEAYRVSGNLFGMKGDHKKSRTFEDEIWYTRRQWSDWKFDLFSLPGCISSFVKKHVVTFYRGNKYPPKILKVQPVSIYLGEGQALGFPRKQPKVYKLFDPGSREEDMACLFGQPFYQLPKLDGRGMTLSTDPVGKVYLTDRMGISYSLKTLSGHKRFSSGKKIHALVELVPNESPKNSYRMYLSQIVVNFGHTFVDYATEIASFQEQFNRETGGEVVLGRKEGWLTRNKVLVWKPTMASDGVIYVPAVATSTWLDPFRYKIHSFIKPFEGTDTSPYIIANEQTRISVGGLTNNGDSMMNVLYRGDGCTLMEKCPHSADILKVFKSNIVNPNDFFGDTMMSPLLYEGYHIPPGIIDDNNNFVVTHVRGDKHSRACNIARTGNLDWLEKGVFGFTKFGNNSREVADNFFLNLSSSRVTHLLPLFIGKYTDFVDNFIKDWKDGREVNCDYLNNFVTNNCFNGDADDLIYGLKLALPPEAALCIASSIFRFPHVNRSLYVKGDKIKTRVSIDLNCSYKVPTMDSLYDAFGNKTDLLN